MDDAIVLLEKIGRVRELIRARLQPVHSDAVDDLSLKEAFLLFSLPEDGGITPSEIAAERGISPSTLTGILDRLEEKGWIERRRDPADRRSVVIARHPGVTERQRAFHARLGEALTQVMSRMDKDDVERLKTGLDAFMEALAAMERDGAAR